MNSNHNNFPKSTSISPGPNYQQYDSSNNNATISLSQSTSNNISNNDNTVSNNQHDTSNNVPCYNYQLPTFNNASFPHFYSQNIGQNPLQSSGFPLLNSLGINVN